MEVAPVSIASRSRGHGRCGRWKRRWKLFIDCSYALYKPVTAHAPSADRDARKSRRIFTATTCSMSCSGQIIPPLARLHIPYHFSSILYFRLKTWLTILYLVSRLHQKLYKRILSAKVKCEIVTRQFHDQSSSAEIQKQMQSIYMGECPSASLLQNSKFFSGFGLNLAMQGQIGVKWQAPYNFLGPPFLFPERSIDHFEQLR